MIDNNPYLEAYQVQQKLLSGLSKVEHLEIVYFLRYRKATLEEIETNLAFGEGKLKSYLDALIESGLVVKKIISDKYVYALINNDLPKMLDVLRSVISHTDISVKVLGLLSGDMDNMVPVHVDPVCKSRISLRTSEAFQLYSGKKYYFCSQQCRSLFRKRPERYLMKRIEI